MTVSPVRRWLTLGVSTVALATAAPALAQTAAAPPAKPTAAPAPPAAASGNQIEELVVTAERRESSIQDTPVTVSAFSADTLKAKRLDGGENLVLSVPNVNYSRGNFGGYNFSIRGIGTKLVSNTGDPGVSFNINELPVGANHLGDADFFDVERVEVLRGPQGTLFGRTATGGAVNVVTAKPTDIPGGSVTAEFGNFDSKKVTGFVNVPVNDYFAFRLAGVFIDRDGFGQNLNTGNSVDGRLLHSYRATFQLKFNDKFKANLIYEHFNEKDDRNRVGKQLCIKDPGLASVGGVPTNSYNQGFTSQGCTPGDAYSDQAFGTLNSKGTLAGIFNLVSGLSNQDVFGNHPLQNHNLHDIESTVDPIYQANSNFVALHMDYELNDNLTLSSISGYNRNIGSSVEDYDRIVATTPFGTSPAAGNAIGPAIASAFGIPVALGNAIYAGQTPLSAGYPGLFPGGVVNDPQLGNSNLQRVYDVGDAVNDELTQEVRLSSHFKGPLNFTVGGIFVHQVNFSNYYVLFNSATAYLQVQNSLAVAGGAPAPFTIDPASRPTGFGHNYYDSRYGDELNSYAGFGEVNYKLTDDLKITGGFRYTVDHKKGNLYPINLTQPGSGPGVAVHPNDSVEAPTGRFNVEWTPHLGFTNQTLVYGTYSRGYKPGGFNTPCQNVDGSSGYSCGYAATYEPEYVDAFELGTKNTLFNGSLVLNATAFYYMYQGYQISSIVRKSSVQQNIDADIYGAELESIWSPVRHLTLNANIGYLHTKITSGTFTDQAYLTEGDPNLTLLKASDGSNCVVNTQGLATAIAVNEGLPGTPNVPGFTGNSIGLLGGCSGALAAFGLYDYSKSPNVQTNPTPQANGSSVAVGQGVLVNLNGNDLPNSPNFTVSLGAQYVYELPGEWNATIRGDYYWQDDSYARVYNQQYDKLRSYENVNATLTFDNARLGLNVQLFVKNLTDSQPYTDLYLTDASSGLFLNSFTLDPRTYGVSLTKRF